MRSKFAACAGGILVALLALAGCVESKTAEVAGTVTFNGEPVKKGAISFIPADGNTPTAGGEIKDGRYSVKVPVTAMKVTIRAPKVVGKQKLYDTPDSKQVDKFAESLPDKYNKQTELTYEVKPGKNQKDFELKSE